MTRDEILGAIDFINMLGQTDIESALHAFQTTDVMYQGHPLYYTMKLGLLVDLSVQQQQPEILRTTIDEMESLIVTDPEEHPYVLRFELKYYLGTAYQALSGLTETSRIPAESRLLQSSKRAFRNCFQDAYLVVFLELLPRAYVNYGNLLSSFGRHFGALLAYDAALRFDPEHGMALGNKAIELEQFAWMTGSHEVLTSVEALGLAQTAAELDSSLEHGEGAVQAFVLCATRIHNRLDHLDCDMDSLRQLLQSSPQPTDDPYNEFIERHDLYLNVCVHEWSCETQFRDNLFFDYITSLGDDGVFEARARIFNEAKEAFVTARHFAFISGAEMEFYASDSQMTQYADLLEYANYGLKSGVLKASFTTAYSVFDKIGAFINDEFKVVSNPNAVYFDKVLWSDLKNFKMTQQVIDQNDPNLVALADLGQDLAAPDSSLKEIRNTIVHRHLVVHDFVKMVGLGSSEENHIEYSDLFQRTIELLTLVKAAMIYLASYLHQKERMRALEAKGPIVPMIVLCQDEVIPDMNADESDS